MALSKREFAHFYEGGARHRKEQVKPQTDSDFFDHGNRNATCDDKTCDCRAMRAAYLRGWEEAELPIKVDQ